MDFMFKKIN